MTTQFAQTTARLLVALGLGALLNLPHEVFAQQPSVTSAVLRWPSARDSNKTGPGRVFLSFHIAGLSPDQLKVLKEQDVVIADNQNRTFTPVGTAMPGRGPATPGSIREPLYIFLIPYSGTLYELRLKGYAPVQFRSDISLAKSGSHE
jgi:hypothetical protein